jgi:hypothetical protein
VTSPEQRVSPEERIKELSRKSAIDPAAAERLLAAVRPEGRSSLSSGLSWNPFERWGAGRCIAGGVGSAILSALYAHRGVRFDGFLDVGVAPKDFGWHGVVIDQITLFPLGALVFWGVGRALGRMRLVDAVATVGLSRAPAVVMALPLALLGAAVRSGEDLSALGTVAVCVSIIGIALQMVLLFLGFRTATGLQAARLTLGFVGAVLGAELAGQLMLHFLSQP